MQPLHPSPAGIVTEFKIRLHKVPAIFTTFTFTVGQPQAIDFLVWYQEHVLNTASSKITFDLRLDNRGFVTGTVRYPGR